MSTVRAMLAEAQACRQRGDWVAVETHCRRALQAEPTNVEALCQLGDACRAQGRTDEGIAHLEQAKQLAPLDADIESRLQAALATRDNAEGLHFANLKRLAEAEACFRRAIQRRPSFAQALHNLGVTLEKQDRLPEAVDVHRQALAIKPDYAAAHRNLGVALERLGKLADAENAYRTALQLQPDFAESWNGLGVTLEKQQRLDEAATAFRRAIALQPAFAEAHGNLGSVLETQNKLDEALAEFRVALELNPNGVEVYYNLGSLLKRKGKLDEALLWFQQALAFSPQSTVILGALGDTLRRQEKLDESLEYFRRASALAPDNAELITEVGIVLGRQGRTAEALAEVERALAKDPDCATANNFRACMALDAGQIEEAIVGFRRAVQANSPMAQLHTNYGLALLLTGEFAAGWPEYEYRLKTEKFAHLQLPQPRWKGEDIRDKTILIREEQGLGDTLQFIRYARPLAERAGQVLVECRKPLAKLLANAPGVRRVIVEKEPRGHFDAYVNVLSLPGLFHGAQQNFAADMPYLFTDENLAGDWRRELASYPGLKVGIAWQGDPSNESDDERSFPLSMFAGIAKLPGVQLFSLQWQTGREQLAKWENTSRIVDLGDRLGDFHHTAAIMRSLDLIITCDSAPAHLAGGLGVPVWTVLPHVPDWRWFLDRSDSPWYPTMRLYRQSQRYQWQEVFARVERDLSQLALRV